MYNYLQSLLLANVKSVFIGKGEPSIPSKYINILHKTQVSDFGEYMVVNPESDTWKEM